MKVLKKAAKTRKVASEEVLSAFSVIEKAKIEPSGFLDTLGGSESPGRTWMLICTAEVGVGAGIILFLSWHSITCLLHFMLNGTFVLNCRSN